MNEIILILQIITVSITSLIAVMSFFLTNKRTKNEASRIITEYRHQRWQELLAVSSGIGAKVMKLRHDKSKNLLTSLTESVAKISYVLNKTYNVDTDIIDLAHDIRNLAIDYCDDKIDYNVLENVYKKFYFEVSIYSQVEWSMIKDQARGKGTEFKDWDENYNKIRENYNSQTEKE